MTMNYLISAPSPQPSLNLLPAFCILPSPWPTAAGCVYSKVIGDKIFTPVPGMKYSPKCSSKNKNKKNLHDALIFKNRNDEEGRPAWSSHPCLLSRPGESAQQG